MRKASLILAVTMASTAITGCLSISSLQTAEILPVGENRVELGAGFYTSPSIDEVIYGMANDPSSDTNDEEYKSIKIPYFEAGFRMGLTEKYEMGARYTLPGVLAVDGKYSLLDREDFDIAVGLVAAYQSYSVTADKLETHILDLSLPLYASVRLNKSFAFYGTPKFILRNAKSESEYEGVKKTSTGVQRMVGLTVGTMIGSYPSDMGVALEVTYVKDTERDFTMLQVGGAFFQ